ncbi:hypothetical protein COV04_03970 [Candidatus Uhrbacteria bacterium CG10_big_fil_rev_8_21_14_0_10_48_11]|uniref:THIF-type NAD/FAD binding fold domain-containing protein n=1 Tax=Candidatus Uhrbacteria bacterium CG10_big_fil_rev_8_21_14_0_10_48_11 TaxID=1975037 RepID=A0A2M8LDM5_9BACT|nr:MAG: hypothetical protein COV04_03970 [Candidatus Uhrbacteria bacterium CG10_big_fil_rev_8_21_14_0_10_48_11]
MAQTLEALLKAGASKRLPSEPVLFNLSLEADRSEVAALLEQYKIQQVVDDYTEQLTELYQIEHPSDVYAPTFATAVAEHVTTLEKEAPLWSRGRWAYFPWMATIVHILEEAPFQKVRTARNRNLITAEEQQKFYEAVVGVAGLSVGNSVALAIVLQGGAKHIRLADHDALALSNTNRVRAGVADLGLPKVEVSARQIYLLNPYATVELFPEGLNPGNISDFFSGPPKLDIVIDEVDNLAVKYLIREQAKQRRLAVVMAADNGDNAVVDVERYDQNPDLPFFQGRLGAVTYDELRSLDKFGIGKMITKHVGPENVTERMQESLLEMGKTIVSWPQLGGAALLNGAAVAYAVRKIITGQPLEDNRALISLDEKLIPTYNSKEEIEKRARVAATFRNIFGL